jgi:putative lipoic acid-binding regulatory protein
MCINDEFSFLKLFLPTDLLHMDEEQLNRMRDRLNEIHRWPSVFMFKFILPTDETKITELKLIFGESAEFKERLSAKGNYTSITVREMMLDADSIFDRYTKASAIKGIISL